jgi:uroporphyrinogen III methyltransferase / synthase
MGGIVYLVGAGPGDPGLVTARGLACIRRAGVLVYDRLVSPALVAQAGPETVKIYVGKESGRHGRKQSDINGLLADLALEGKAVCRLKGGDPFVFGRGGEEAEWLRALGVPYEVVPGITSGIAAAAYAGIPVTHRDFAGAVTLVTGHDAPAKRGAPVDWDSLATAGGTLLIYMGVEALADAAGRLINGGRGPETPVAVIRWGTRSEQQVVSGTLGGIADAVRRASLESPAMIVVGEVAALRERLAWAEARPLFGQRVLVPLLGGATAPAVSGRLREAGAEVWEWPVAAIGDPPFGWAKVDEAVRRLSGYETMLFAGEESVGRFMSRLLAAGSDLRALSPLRVGAVDGPTLAALAAAGLRADIGSEGLAGRATLVVGEAGAAEGVAAGLRAAGALADAAATHVWLPRLDLAPLLRESLATGEIAQVLLMDPGILPLLEVVAGGPEMLPASRIVTSVEELLSVCT